MNKRFDSVVILLAPTDWFADEYWRGLATHLAADVPVYVVLADRHSLPGENSATFEVTGDVAGARIIHVSQHFTAAQAKAVHLALRGQGVVRPLLWVADARFAEVAIQCFAAMKVWFIGGAAHQADEKTAAQLIRAVRQCELLVAPGAGALEDFRRATGYFGDAVVLPSRQPQPCLAAIRAAVQAAARQARDDGPRLNILVLYDGYYTYVGTIRDYLQAFPQYSRHRYWFITAVNLAECRFDMSVFDAVFVHYSIRLCLPQHMNPTFVQAMHEFGGLKALFIQDEYDVVNQTRDWIEKLGLHVVFTCVPQPFVNVVYPRQRFPHVRFETILTGYVPENAVHLPWGKPLAERAVMVGYRGRKLPFYYGELGREKLLIGQKMREICRARGIACDIEWEEDKRIYGPAWLQWLGGVRATLGSESGSNLFDWDGSLQKNITAALDRNPRLTYEEACERFFQDREGEVLMNQISPRIFEAIAVRTALILFEGEYSGVVRPDVHFILLKKDFSNVDEVLAKLHDDQYIQRMTDRAYQDVIASDRYSYRAFARRIDGVLAEELTHGRGYYLESALVAAERDGRIDRLVGLIERLPDMPHKGVPAVPETRHMLGTGPVATLARRAGRRMLPAGLRRSLKPLLKSLYHWTRRNWKNSRESLPGLARRNWRRIGAFYADPMPPSRADHLRVFSRRILPRPLRDLLRPPLRWAYHTLRRRAQTRDIQNPAS